jgi:prepilin-type N-terminal cleavage/methylation domain-containing protein
MSKKGFTLIELLVVVAIIGILASVVLASLNTARMKGRDAQRKSDTHQITLAIQLYLNENGVFPPSGGATAPNVSWSNSSDGSWTTLATALASHISDLPTDPQQSSNPSIWGANGYAYSYVRCTGSYLLVYHLEETKGPDPGSYCGGLFYQYGGAGANTQVKTIGDYY